MEFEAEITGEVTCLHCGKSFETTIVGTVEIELEPDYADRD